jgi:hypothetical protein
MPAAESWGQNLAQTFARLVDVLLPGDADFPAASATGTHGLVMDRLRGRMGSEALEAIAAALGGLQWTEQEQIETVQRLEQNDPALFSELRFCTYFSYYESPVVIAVLRRLGHDYNDAPQPLGYAMQPFDPTPGADLPLVPKGTYKKTDDITRVDISSLPDLESLAVNNGADQGG